MRLLACAASCLCASSVVAAELPISGIYGDEMGCARLQPDFVVTEPGGIQVYADRIEGWEWGCSWGDVWQYPASVGQPGGTFGVQGLCAGEGTPFLEQYIVEIDRDDITRMTVSDAKAEWFWDLALCEAAPEGGGKG